MSAPNSRIAAVVVISVALGAGAGYWFASRPSGHGVPAAPSGSTPPAAATKQDREILYWHDPMYPQHRFDKPGKSPFMDMQLVPVYADSSDGSTVVVSPRTLQNLGIRTATAQRGDFRLRLDTVGTVQADERRIEVVQSRSAGWVEKLQVRAVAEPVRRGQLLAEIYSPDLLAAQEEFLLLQQNRDDAALAQSARTRLSFLGLSTEQIAELEHDRHANHRVRVFAPISGVVAELGVRQGGQVSPGMSMFSLVDLSTVWMVAEVPESQLASVSAGTPVEAQVKALPGQTFEGKVEYIYPEVNPVTRTVRVRARLANPGLKLSPGMVADVTLSGGAGKSGLLVPSEALIHTGKRSVVIVADAQGRFRAAEVMTGMEADGKTEVLRGLDEGAQVVVSGQFLIDSEASLRSSLKRLDVPDGNTGEQARHTQDALHTGMGVVKSVDAAAGRLTITHDPIASLDWPEMTMGFAAKDAALLAGIKPGQRIEFEFSKTGDDYVVSRITTKQQAGTAP